MQPDKGWLKELPKKEEASNTNETDFLGCIQEAKNACEMLGVKKAIEEYGYAKTALKNYKEDPTAKEEKKILLQKELDYLYARITTISALFHDEEKGVIDKEKTELDAQDNSDLEAMSRVVKEANDPHTQDYYQKYQNYEEMKELAIPKGINNVDKIAQRVINVTKRWMADLDTLKKTKTEAERMIGELEKKGASNESKSPALDELKQNKKILQTNIQGLNDVVRYATSMIFKEMIKSMQVALYKKKQEYMSVKHNKVKEFFSPNSPIKQLQRALKKAIKNTQKADNNPFECIRRLHADISSIVSTLNKIPNNPMQIDATLQNKSPQMK